MATSSIRRFSRQCDLSSVSPERLTLFLSPYAGYLASRGFILPEPGVGLDEKNYQSLLDILMTPNADVPCGLVDSIYCVSEVANPESMYELLDEASACGISIDGNSELSPIDVAIQVWLHDKSIIEHKHAEHYLIKPCTFVYFQADKKSDHSFIDLSANTLKALEHNLDEWFQSRQYGQGCRVFCYPKEDGIWFSVWHGAPYGHERCIDHDEPSCVCHHQERYDVLIYQPATGELQIDADTTVEREIYRKLFGRHLFSDDHHFPGTAIYTLEPLRRDGERSLVCADIDGIEWLRLYKIQFCWGNHIKSTETFESDNVFVALQRGDVVIPHSARITGGCFLIKFVDSKIPRTAEVRPSNIIRYQLDSDCETFEHFLRRRGFALFGYLLLLIQFDFLLNILQCMDSLIPDGLA